MKYSVSIKTDLSYAVLLMLIWRYICAELFYSLFLNISHSFTKSETKPETIARFHLKQTSLISRGVNLCTYKKEKRDVSFKSWLQFAHPNTDEPLTTAVCFS